MDKLINKLKEPSTIKGLVALAGLVGYAVSPEQYNKIMLALPVLIGVWETFRKETK